MKQLLKIYVYGQWHIALCAATLYIGGSHLLSSHPDYLTAIHVFSSTLFVYLLHRIYSRKKMNNTSFQRYSFLSDNIDHAKTTALIAGLAGLITFFFLTLWTQILLVIAGLISLGYILPLIYRKRLRDIGAFKIFFISLVWSVVPILSAIGDAPPVSLIIIALENFFFIFALTIPFDVRDEALDRRAKVSNLTTSLNYKQLKLIMTVMIIAALTQVFLQYRWDIIDLSILLGMCAFYFIQYLGTIQLEKKHEELYYLLFLDGMILIKGAIFILLSNA